MSIIDISNLTFAYDGCEPLFENVSLRLDTDWRLGLTGRNGRGKTTLLQLLMGRHEYRGHIYSAAPFAYFPFTVPDPSKDARGVIRDVQPDCEDWQLACELARVELDEAILDRPFSSLSCGEQTRLLLAALFVRDGQFLLIDEPTNHLDGRGRALVADYLNSKRGFLLVSHDRAFLDACVDHILSINKTDIVLQKGNFSSFLLNKERQDSFEAAQDKRLRADIRRLNEAAARASRWSNRAEAEKHTRNAGLRPDRGFLGHKAAKMMQRAKSIESRRTAAAAEKAGLLHNTEQAEPLKLHPLDYRADTLAELRGVAIQYGALPVLQDVRLTIRRGARIALDGPNGCGKSSLLRLIAGENVPHTGFMRIGSGLRASVVPQDASFLAGSLHDYAAQCGVPVSLFFTILRKLDFPRGLLAQDMSGMSAGQKKKVLLARSLCEQAHLYIWDEPLNYIDIFSRMQLERLLTEFPLTLLFVEHDRAFREAVATETVTLP